MCSTKYAQARSKPFQKGVGKARTESFPLEVHPARGALPAQRVLSRSGLLPCVWAWPTIGPHLLVTKTLPEAQPTPAQPACPGRALPLPPASPCSSHSPGSPASPSAAHSPPREDSHSQPHTGQFSSRGMLLAFNVKYFPPNKEQSFPTEPHRSCQRFTRRQPKLRASETWGSGAHGPWTLVGRVPYAATW